MNWCFFFSGAIPGSSFNLPPLKVDIIGGGMYTTSFKKYMYKDRGVQGISFYTVA